MKNRFYLLIFLLTNLYTQVLADVPVVFLTDIENLIAFKAAIEKHPEKFQEQIRQFKEAAKIKLKAKVYSVMDKEQVPPSGDKHDYMSQGPYWWPDPEKPDGLPYIRKDGEKNPEINKITDHKYLDELIDAVRVLSLAYYYFEDEKYAKKASKFLRTWFLDEKTAMNPNLNYGQAIPGRTKGRGIGIIETRQLCYLIDAIGLIEKSISWTAMDQVKMKEWMADYLDWLLNSKHGKDEAVHGNNHTTWYFVQTIAMALYVNEAEIAQKLVNRGYKLIIEKQIEADGTQPSELARTRSWDYSTMNLNAIYTFGRYAEKFDVDIWKLDKVKFAMDYLIPFLDQFDRWNYEQITEFRKDRLEPSLRLAYYQYGEKNYQELIHKEFDHIVSEDFWNFYYPITP